ncbi:hypothetical protein F9Y84_06970 [Pseudoalteromonas peptidolytica]|nr:hypothetical protein [Pseudoalteromonas peptidolytica]
MRLIKLTILRRENSVYYYAKTLHLVVLNRRCLAQLASDLRLQIEQVLSIIGISSGEGKY